MATFNEVGLAFDEPGVEFNGAGSCAPSCVPGSFQVGANGSSTLTLATCCGCGGSGSGSGSGGGYDVDPIEFECLDTAFLDCDGSPCAPGNIVSAYWCLQIDGTPPGDTACARLFGYSFQLDPSLAECGWGWQSSDEATAHSEDPDEWCNSGPTFGTRSAEVIMRPTTAGGVIGGTSIVAPSCGFYVRAVTSFNGATSTAVYFIDKDAFACTGPNTMDLIGEEHDSGVSEDWPATITITPCLADGV